MEFTLHEASLSYERETLACQEVLIDEAIADRPSGSFAPDAEMLACPTCGGARPAPPAYPAKSDTICLMPPLGGGCGASCKFTKAPGLLMGAAARARAIEIGKRADAAAEVARKKARNRSALDQFFAATAAAEKIVNKALGSPAEPAAPTARQVAAAAKAAAKAKAKAP